MFGAKAGADHDPDGDRDETPLMVGLQSSRELLLLANEFILLNTKMGFPQRELGLQAASFLSESRIMLLGRQDSLAGGFVFIMGSATELRLLKCEKDLPLKPAHIKRTCL